MGYDALEKRLRSWSRDMRLFGNADQCVREAADAIADLRARNEALAEERDAANIARKDAI